MIASALILSILLAQEAVTLRYGDGQDRRQILSADVTLDLKMAGTDAALNFIRASSPIFSFSKLHLRAEGVRRFDPKSGVLNLKTEFAEARVDGVFDDEPFEFDFQRRAPPGDLKEDKLRGALWAITMNGHPKTLSPMGEVRGLDAGQDAIGEALDLLAWPFPRLPENPVKPGGSWEVRWRGERKEKRGEGRFLFCHKGALDKLAGGRAHVSVAISGEVEIPAAARDPNVEAREMKVDGRARFVMAATSGQLLSAESEGTLRAKYKATDPNTGQTHELDITFTITSRQEAKP